MLDLCLSLNAWRLGQKVQITGEYKSIIDHSGQNILLLLLFLQKKQEVFIWESSSLFCTESSNFKDFHETTKKKGFSFFLPFPKISHFPDSLGIIGFELIFQLFYWSINIIWNMCLFVWKNVQNREAYQVVILKYDLCWE